MFYSTLKFISLEYISVEEKTEELDQAGKNLRDQITKKEEYLAPIEENLKKIEEEIEGKRINLKKLREKINEAEEQLSVAMSG